MADKVQQSCVGWLDWLARGLSFASLAISMFALYYGALQPADISAHLSAPNWIWRSRLGIKFDCVLSNTGTRTGVVEDIVMVLENTATHQRFTFVPHVVVDEQKFTTQERTTPDLSWIQGQVRPISVPGHGAVMIPLLFQAYEGELAPGRYEVTPQVREGAANWRPQHSFHVNLLAGTIEEAKQGTKIVVVTEELEEHWKQLK
jgi:hypothetical protein